MLYWERENKRFRLVWFINFLNRYHSGLKRLKKHGHQLLLFTQAFKTRPGVTAAVVSPQPRSPLDELKILITIHSMDVLTVSETWLDISVLD